MYLDIPGYVYKITNKNTGEYYIGSRVANIRHRRLPQHDLWVKYFTSSSFVKKYLKDYSIEDFIAEVLYQDTDKDKVYWYEQDLIKSHIDDQTCLNKHYIDRNSGKKMFSTQGMEPHNKGKPSPNKGVPRTKETVDLMSKNRKGKNIGQVPWNKGKTYVEIFGEEKAKELSKMMSDHTKTRTGENNSFYGKTHSEETRSMLREAQKRQVECPHCSKIGAVSIMKRWHFDNCKKKGT